MGLVKAQCVWFLSRAVLAPCLVVLGCARSLAAASPEDKKVVASLAGSTACSHAAGEIHSGERRFSEMGGGECLSYRIALSANQFLQVTVEQKDIDVVVSVFSPNGIQLSRVDRPNGSRGTETISIIAPVEGFYLLDVRSLEEVSARGEYELSIAQLRLAGPTDTTRIKAEQLVSHAELLRASGKEIRTAIAKFLEAADISHSLKNSYEEAVAWNGAGISCPLVGDSQIAIDYLKHAALMFIQQKNAAGIAMVRTNMGWPYLYLGDLDNSLESFSSALKIHREQNSIRGQGITLYGLGWVHAVRGEDQPALLRFTESLAFRRQALDRSGEARTLTGIGKVQSRLGQYKQAVESLTLALQVLPQRPRNADEADALANLAWVYRDLNQPQMAMDLFTKALVIRKEREDLLGEATTRYGMSLVHHDTGHLVEAESEIEETLRIIELLRTKGLNLQLRITYFSSVQDYYDFYITLLLEMHQLYPAKGYAAKALHACERARARGFLDLLAEAKIDLRQDVDQVLVNRERIVAEKISKVALGRRQEPVARNVSPDATEEELRDLRNESESIKSQIRQVNARDVTLTQPQPLTASEIQKNILDRDTLLLQYVLSGERSFLLAVTTDEITTYTLPGRTRIENLARRFYEASTLRNQVASRPVVGAMRKQIAGADAEADKLAGDLSEILIAPVAKKLGTKRLLIVANGALQLVPFAALPERTGASNPLIEGHEVVVLSSVTALRAIRDETRSRNSSWKSVLVLADPVFEKDDGRVKTGHASSADGQRKFPRLTSSRWEGEQIVSLVPPGDGKLMIDFAANRSFTSRVELGRYRVLHFATHALIDFEHPALSGIVLSTIDEEGKPRNGFLSLDDIFKLETSAELVVLSGCRTALGKDYAGEGLVGLTRAFMYAGASRVVVSLWDVSDKPTSELMVRFYRHLFGPEKLTPAAALRAAQLELRKDPRWHSPYYWAPFILQGDWL